MRRIAAFLMLALAKGAFAQSNSAPPPPRPIEQFAALPFMVGPELSPNGKKIAARVAVGGTQMLAVVPLNSADGQIQTIPFGENDINFWRWVNDDWLVVGVGGENAVEGEKWYISRLVSIKADGTKAHRLGWRDAAQIADDLIWVAQDGSPRILFGMQTSIYSSDIGFWRKVVEADVSTGRIREVLIGKVGVTSWYADASGTIRMGIGTSTDGRSQRLFYRPDAKSAFRVIDRANTRRSETLLAPAMFLPDPTKAIAIADDEKGFGSVWELDLNDMKLGKQLIGVPGFDVTSVITDAGSTRVLGANVVEKASGVRWLDPDLAKLQGELDKAVKGQRAEIVSWNRDQSRLLVHVTAGDMPGSYYVFDRAQGVMQRFAHVDEALKNKRGHPVRTISYKARDGLEISAVLTMPAGRPEKNLPLIVMPHGGPFARDKESWDWWTQFLADRGYAVIQPNYRGSSGFGTEFARKGEGQWGLAMQDDLNDAVTHLAQLGIADPKRVCMVGGSYGGYAAMRAAQRDGQLYRCAVSYAGVSDLARMRVYNGRFLFSGASSDWLQKQAPDFKAISPLFGAEQVSIPLLLMHGKVDRRVPVAQSRLMAERLKAAGKKVIYVEQPLGDHFFSRSEDRLEFLKYLEAFLKEHNPA
jgi:dipeptidyl aminopeptidase/acylaminoacyl peptidase